MSKPAPRHAASGAAKGHRLSCCMGHNPPVATSWSDVDADRSPSGSRQNSQASSIVSESGDEDACIKTGIVLTQTNKLNLARLKYINVDHANARKPEPSGGRISMMKFPWADGAIQTAAGPDTREGPLVLATSHVHTHKKRKHRSGTARTGSDASLLADTENNVLLFAPDAARAGKEGLSLRTERYQTRRDRATGDIYAHLPAQTLKLKSAKPLTDALLAMPDADESIRTVARLYRFHKTPSGRC